MKTTEEERIFSYNNYKAYLIDKVQALRASHRGIQRKLAQAIGCQPTYVSAVLNGSAHLSLEQAEALNRFLNHSEAEAHVFMLLVQKERAGSVGLRRYIERELKKAKSQNLNLKNRLAESAPPNLDRIEQYFSSWKIAAVHVLLTIPEYQSLARLAQKLSVPVNVAERLCNKLIDFGYAKRVDNRILPTTERFHLDKSLPSIRHHHTNWRLRAIESLDRSNSETDFHYSSVVSISEADYDRIFSLQVDHIERAKSIVRSSTPEKLASFQIDFYEELP